MSRYPIVLLDVDGPLTSGYLDAAREFFAELGHDVSRVASAWDPCEALGLGRDHADRQAWRAHKSRAGFCQDFAPRAGMVGMVGRVREWADVYAVTAPLGSSRTWAHDRALWLSTWFSIDRDHVVSTDAKHLVRGDAFVDDKPENIVAWQAAWSGAAVLWREPYNAGVSWPCVAGHALELERWLEEHLL